MADFNIIQLIPAPSGLFATFTDDNFKPIVCFALITEFVEGTDVQSVQPMIIIVDTGEVIVCSFLEHFSGIQWG